MARSRFDYITPVARPAETGVEVRHVAFGADGELAVRLARVLSDGSETTESLEVSPADAATFAADVGALAGATLDAKLLTFLEREGLIAAGSLR